MTDTPKNHFFTLQGEKVPVSPRGVPIPSNRPCEVSSQTEVLPAQVRDLADLLAKLAATQTFTESACKRQGEKLQ